MSVSNPFSRPHGVWNPSPYTKRSDAHDRFSNALASMSNLQFAQGVALLGMRGIGKTTELLRFHRQFSDSGWLSLYVSLGPRVPFAVQLAGELQERLRSRGGRDPFADKRSRTTLSAKAKIPWTPVELGFERGPKKEVIDDGLFAILAQTISDISKTTPVAIVLDEGDFLTKEVMNTVLAPLLHEAAVNNSPLLFVTAGSTPEFLHAIGGVQTFVPYLTRPVELARLTDSESRDLLVGTAAVAAQDWSRAPALDDLIEECSGIPRSLQNAGSLAFGGVDDVGVNRALERAAASCRSQRVVLRRTLVSQVRNHQLPRAIEASLRAVGRVDLVDLLDELSKRITANSGQTTSSDSTPALFGFDDLDIDEVLTTLSKLGACGDVEFHVDSTYELLRP